MGSINAQRVAQKISASISKGEKVVLAKVIKEAGYAPSISRTPQRVTDTQAFKKAFALEKMSLIDGMQSEINRIKLAMARKNLDNEEYRTLAGSLDLLTKNYQLLSGGATERKAFVLPSEVIANNEILPNAENVVQLEQKEEVKELKNGSTEP